MPTALTNGTDDTLLKSCTGTGNLQHVGMSWAENNLAFGLYNHARTANYLSKQNRQMKMKLN
jgi:hypothetical protein